MPLQNTITVITICFNNLQDVIQTSQSVDIQVQQPFEHLIIDGSNNSDIKNYLEQNSGPAYRRWICEPDNGIADAFNKGIQNAQGNILVMLNAGDSFYNEQALSAVTHAFNKNESLQWVHGKYKTCRGKQWVIVGNPFKKNKLYKGMRNICHQTMFVKKQLHDKHGLYYQAQEISMDYDFLCRIANEPSEFLPVPLVTFAPGGVSTMSYMQYLKEVKAAYQKYYGQSVALNLWQIRSRLFFHLLHSPIGPFLYKIVTLLKLENV
ncbi:glycosyltransferase [Ferruginibacter sp.]|nr:glycosyltransferase [Ferruginibacter sp.]